MVKITDRLVCILVCLLSLPLSERPEYILFANLDSVKSLCFLETVELKAKAVNSSLARFCFEYSATQYWKAPRHINGNGYLIVLAPVE